ncbi:hypothetical protein Cob_v012525 [Colletotrichum orbiculare MAFF 240422]|uniref:Uncharacterized protein n=1 Tax=Colletotrichum orbiculare (strain 104-T / ATCC 96160 / CBS 514.97 / LARS 414 / MAFF 240422) TaxID=1213857 RepID=A0A484FAV2_COLOR|nr:hypothetical protein Cob_v012525 [Colletotrichum orbiculare MAFF 240422]
MSKGTEVKYTDTLYHRYANRKILIAKLVEFGFPEKEQVIEESDQDGFLLKLSRNLESAERESIFKAFEKARAKKGNGKKEKEPF